MSRHRFCVLLAISLASRSATSAAQQASHSHTARQAPIPGKVPITSRSPAAIALYLEGRTLQEALKPHEAHARYGRAFALDRGFALAAYGLAATAPSPRAAREHLRQALVLGDSASAGERLVIRVLEARLDRGPAAWAAVAESLVALHPDDERAHWMLGSARSALGEYAAALAAYRGAIGINPEFALAYNSIGYAERNAGHPAAAEAAFRRYIALVPDDPNPYDSYGELLLTLGRFDEAIAQYRRAQAIDPAFAGSFVGIASAEALAGRHEAGRAEARRLVARRDPVGRHAADPLPAGAPGLEGRGIRHPQIWTQPSAPFAQPDFLAPLLGRALAIPDHQHARHRLVALHAQVAIRRSHQDHLRRRTERHLGQHVITSRIGEAAQVVDSQRQAMDFEVLNRRRHDRSGRLMA